jgi:hypothetical protein
MASLSRRSKAMAARIQSGGVDGENVGKQAKTKEYIPQLCLSFLVCFSRSASVLVNQSRCTGLNSSRRAKLIGDEPERLSGGCGRIPQLVAGIAERCDASRLPAA